ncbi:MAG: hypothetical protein SGPRY_001750 [Prymnesium sp.]
MLGTIVHIGDAVEVVGLVVDAPEDRQDTRSIIARGDGVEDLVERVGGWQEGPEGVKVEVEVKGSQEVTGEAWAAAKEESDLSAWVAKEVGGWKVEPWVAVAMEGA